MSDIKDYLEKTDHLKSVEQITEHAKKSINLNENPFERWDNRHDKWIAIFKNLIN